MSGYDWNLIKSFLAIAETGSLSAAARRLDSNQPTLGRHAAELERQLGATLFERRPNGMALTEAGTALVEHARRIEVEAAALSLTATGRAEAIAGTVRIAASEVVAHAILPEIVVALRREEPELDVEIVSSNLVQNLLIRDADIAIRMVEPRQNELIARKVNDVAIGAFAARDYLDRFGRPETPDDLRRHSLVGFERDDFIVRATAKIGPGLARTDFGVRTEAQYAYWKLVEAGAGIGFAQFFVARRARRPVEAVLPDLLVPGIPVYVAAHRELRTSLRVRRAFDFLAEALAALPLSERKL